MELLPELLLQIHRALHTIYLFSFSACLNMLNQLKKGSISFLIHTRQHATDLLRALNISMVTSTERAMVVG